MNRNARKKLELKSYRDALVYEHIRQGLAFQINATREQRGWSQHQLAEKARMKQVQISRYENPDYGKYTLSTLLRLASAFDVALAVRFVPFSELVDWASRLSHRTLAVPSFDEEHTESNSGAESSESFSSSETTFELPMLVVSSDLVGNSDPGSTGGRLLRFSKRDETTPELLGTRKTSERVSPYYGGTYGK